MEKSEMGKCPDCRFWEYTDTEKTKSGKFKKWGICQMYDEEKNEHGRCCRFQPLDNDNL